jgi:hypothetical protein
MGNPILVLGDRRSVHIMDLMKVLEEEGINFDVKSDLPKVNGYKTIITTSLDHQFSIPRILNGSSANIVAYDLNKISASTVFPPTTDGAKKLAEYLKF